MSKVLVTGGAGFIGSHLCDALIARGDKVVVLDNFSSSTHANIAHLRHNPNFQLVEGSILDEELLDRVSAECEWTAHLASACGVRLIMAEPLQSLRSMVRGTEMVLDAAHRHGHARLLLTSTSETYGRNPQLLDEDADRIFGPITFNRWAYGTAKAIDEFTAFAFGAELGLPSVVVRLFNTVGPRQSAAYGMVLPRFIEQAMTGRDLTVYGDGQQSRTFCHVNDVIPAVLALAEHPDAVGRPFNVGSSEETTILDLAHRVIKTVGSTSGVRLVDFEAEHPGDFQDIQRRRPDTRRIRDLIGWEPRKSLQMIVESLVEDSRRRHRPHRL